MSDHPFWLVKVQRITNKHHYLLYLGDQFLKPYYALSRPGTNHDWVEKVTAGETTYLHWNIKMVNKGKRNFGAPSKADQRVLSLDKRVPWQLDEHKAQNIVARG